MKNQSPTCCFIVYGFALNDPPMRQAAAVLLQAGYELIILQVGGGHIENCSPIPGAYVYSIIPPAWSRTFGPLSRWVRWRYFVWKVRWLVETKKPRLVIAIMLHALAALSARWDRPQAKLVACIYDIPAFEDAGRLDRYIFQKGWQALRQANVVWSSDKYKAQLAQERGGLNALPLVCHNCPTLDYLPEPTWPRDPWLRSELVRQGAKLGATGGCILLRTGAIGESGGIEETLEGMAELPEDFVFVMLGRPTAEYKSRLQNQIERLGLKQRAFFWDRPSDEVWKRALQGADIGHLIHGPFPPGRMTRLYELNSSLSNNRLFQYMAAGLPIISYDDPRMADIYKEVDCFRVARLSHLREDIGKIWQELGKNSDLRQRLGYTGRNAHLSRYNWEFQFKPVLNSIINNSSKSA